MQIQPGGGHSQIYGPNSMSVAKKLLSSGEEGIVYADINLEDITHAKHFVDTVGHHLRPDMLSLKVNAAPTKHVHHYS